MEEKDYSVKIKNLTVSYNSAPVLFNCNLTLPQGQVIAIVGPNGAGKSTLLKSILGIVKPIAGSVKFFSSMPLNKATRRKIAYVPQSDSVDWDFPASVFDVALMGRYGHIGYFMRPSKKDKEIALRALYDVDLQEYRDRQISELSGGQKQRVFLARSLAQEADLYFMDEPFKGVDSKTEKAIISIFNTLKSQGKTIVVVHHDLGTVKEYFDSVVLINKKIIASGSVKKVFTSEMISSCYGTTHKV